MVAVALLSSVLTVAAYDRLLLRPALRVAVVDVAGVFRARQADFIGAMAKAATDAEREKVTAAARAFSARLPVALDELARDCHCRLFDKSVLIGKTDAPDLTEQLARMVR